MESQKILLLLAILLISGITDILTKKVYNSVTFPAIIMGLVLGFYYRGGPGLLDSFLGLVICTALFFLLYMWGGFGAGDAKLMMAMGAIIGTGYLFDFILYSAIMGGVMAQVVIIRNRVFFKTWRNVLRFFLFLVPFLHLKPEPLDRKNSFFIPYAYAISLGSFLYMIFGRGIVKAH
jgi:prepilin peptidase CpaA